MADADQLRQVTHDIAYVTALALIQAKGDAANALARLETMRGQVVVRDDETGFTADVVDIAQSAITAAADTHELPDGADGG